MAENLNEAFEALEHLDEQGRKALRLSGAMWEELLREAVARAEKSEWLLERLHSWAAGWGLIFDVSEAAAHWDAEHEHRPPTVAPWYEARVMATNAEIRELRTMLTCAYDEVGRMTKWARAECARAAAARAQRDALLVEIERLKTMLTSSKSGE
jgi:hypothetical protein